MNNIYHEIEINNKSIDLCSKPEKLRERVFHKLSSCSFTFTWWKVRHFQNHVVVCFLAFFGTPFTLAP